MSHDQHDDDQSRTERRPSSKRGLGTQLRTMPRWQKLVLTLGVVLAAAGATGWTVGKTSDAAAAREVRPAPDAAVESGPGTSRLLSNAPPDQPTAEQVAPEAAFVVRVSPTVMRVGVSVLAGFAIGFLLRAFVKTVLLVGLVIGGALFALSYYNVLNIDFSTAERTYASASEWLTDQAARLKDVLVAHLPSSASGGLGAFIGFRRR